jgi:hypothetical protein
VRWHVAAYWDFYRLHHTVIDALQQAATVDASFAEVVRQMMAPDLAHIAGHLATLDLPGDPLVVASIFTSLVSTFAATWLSGNRPDLGRELPDDEAIDTLTTFIHAGIGKRI